MTNIDYKARCEFLRTELEAVYGKLLETQEKCLEAQRIAIQRGWEILELMSPPSK